MIQLDRQRIVEALDELSRRLVQRGVTAELCLFGGAAMTVAFQSRQTTKDIDATSSSAPGVRDPQHRGNLLPTKPHWAKDPDFHP